MLKYFNFFRQFSTYHAYLAREALEKAVSLRKLPTDMTVAKKFSPEKVKKMLMGLEHFDGYSLLFKTRKVPYQVDGLPEGSLKWPNGKEIDIEIVAVSPDAKLSFSTTKKAVG